MSKLDLSDRLPDMSRRDLIRSLSALGACGLLDNQVWPGP
jgi:hypothetical protein